MTLRKGVFITAHNRPEYFRASMDAWRKVRGLDDWKLFIRLEPSPFVQEHIDAIYEAGLADVAHVIVNEETLGVLHHPWVGFEHLFGLYFDFVVRAEDDLLVSDDILEYFGWAAEKYNKNRSVATVHGFSLNEGRDNEVYLSDRFNPWVWGTWHDRWERYIRDTWDHDYSTFNLVPGNESGWDWNLDTRILPANGLLCVVPDNSRVQNIGMWGVHGTPDNIQQAFSYQDHYDPQTYVER